MDWIDEIEKDFGTIYAIAPKIDKEALYKRL